MPSVFKDINLQKKTIKTLGKISPLILFLLTYLLKSNPNNFLSTRARLLKKMETTKKIVSNVRNKDRVVTMTIL